MREFNKEDYLELLDKALFNSIGIYKNGIVGRFANKLLTLYTDSSLENEDMFIKGLNELYSGRSIELPVHVTPDDLQYLVVNHGEFIKTAISVDTYNRIIFKMSV